MKISVVIPVYNAAGYVQQAVESTLEQPETAEVILVEDASTDNSLAICKELETRYPSVRVLQHPNGDNRGAGASRNLGILNSTSEYIAFLDADDYYLPGRFSVARQRFEEDPSIDGVYEAVALHIDSDDGLDRWKNAERSTEDLCTINEQILPEDLLARLIAGRIGFFHVNGLTVKRDVFDKAGLYDEHLRLIPHEDVAMNYRLAATSRLVPGRLQEPVAAYRVHEHNSISAPVSQTKKYRAEIMVYAAVWQWSKKNTDRQTQLALLDRFIRRARELPRLKYSKETPGLILFLKKKMQLVLLSIEYPQVVLTPIFWRYFLGRNSLKLGPFL